MLRRLWKYVRNTKNRELLSWLGGGAVVMVTGTFTLFTYLHDDKKPTASSTTVIAPAVTGITSGHDTVVNAPVNIGVNEKRVGEQITDAQKPLVERLEGLAAQVAREKGLEVAPLRSILVKMGEAGVRDEDIPNRLDENADELIKLRAEIARLKLGPASLASFAQQAQTLIDKGDLDGARAALAEGRAAARTVREQSSGYESDFLAQQAKIDHLQLAYQRAAANYAQAAAVIAPFDQQKQWGFSLARADELNSQGDEFGDNVALAAAIDQYRGCLLLAPRAQRPLDWAKTQNNLGIALETLGDRESGTEQLEEAVAAYRNALQVFARERVPLDWATTQNNLGIALQTLGERGSGTAHLDEAVVAYRAALAERTREHVPFDWAATQNNLGTALATLGQRETGTALLEDAVVAYREALKEDTRERVPLRWATIQNNLGIALTAIGERESGTARLEEAIAAYRDALKEDTRERVPLEWAMTRNNLGTALMAMGERQTGTAQLDEALAAFRDALKEWTRERVPLRWATTQNNLGIALTAIGEHESGTARLDEAVTAFREALKERTREHVPLDWAWSSGNLGVALMKLAERTKKAEMAETGFQQIETALQIMRTGGDAPLAAYFEAHLPEARRIRDALNVP
jgi:tetratricopeptide (TPR) repeat protein